MKLQLSWRELISKDNLADFILTPDEFLAKRKRLSVKEAAYVLNISPRHIRTLISRGVLPCSRMIPRRMPVEEIKKLLDDVDFWESASESELDGKAIRLDKGSNKE